MNDDVLEFLLADHARRPLPELVPRDLSVPEIPRKAVTLIGMRRSGKTYAMYDRMQRLRASGVSRERMLYLNLEDDRLGEPDLSTLDRALELFYRRHPQSRTVTAHLFFDEIQVVPGWERFLRRVIDTEDVRVFVTGPSARLLSREVATSFRGRGFPVEVLPFGLREVARSRGMEPTGPRPPAAPQRSALAGLCDTYLEQGGFPEAQGIHGFDRVPLLQQYVDVVLLKDVAERHAVKNIGALRHLTRALFSANAGPFSVSKFHGALVSQGVKVAKPTLLSYLEHLADAYLVFLLPIRSRSEKQRLVNPRKVYAVDPGLAAAMRTGGAQNVGALLENFVYLELRRELGASADAALSYHRTKSGFEVDFVVESARPGSNLRLVQASATLRAPETRRRELRALEEGMAETGAEEALVVTLDEREEISCAAGTISLVPAWEWALRS